MIDGCSLGPRPLYLSCHGLRLSTCTPAQSFLRCDGEAPTIVLGWAVRDPSGLYIGRRWTGAHGMTQRQTILFHLRPPRSLRALLKSKGFRLVRVVRRGKGGAS